MNKSIKEKTIMENIEIKSTTDYGLFKIMSSNRGLNVGHIDKLAKSMQENPHLFKVNPIIVNENMFIIDGQHRFNAAKKVKMPVYYVIAQGATVEDTRALNTTQVNWSMDDFARSYASTGNDNYKIYLQARAKYPMLAGMAIRIVLGSYKGYGGGEQSSFKSGNFTIGRPNLANLYLEKFAEVQHHVAPRRINRAFTVALLQLLDNSNENKFDVDYFINKLENYEAVRASLNPTPTLIRDGLRTIEDAYNHNRQRENHLRFY